MRPTQKKSCGTIILLLLVANAVLLYNLTQKEEALSCPEPKPCPECPECPECPKPKPCPECPECPKPKPSPPSKGKGLIKAPVPPACEHFASNFHVPESSLSIKIPALGPVIPKGFPSPYVARSPAFTFGPCEEEEEKAIRIQLERVNDTRVKCDKKSGHCRCPTDNLIFDGEKCIEKKEWVNLVGKLKTKWEEIPIVLENYVGTCMLREEIPGKPNQMRTEDMAALSDLELATLWTTIASDDTFTMYYASTFRGKTVMDIGSGFARQTLRFAFYGADVWFFDVSPINLKLIERIARIYGISDNVHVNPFDSLDSLRDRLDTIDKEFDVICGFGSLHHAPSEIIHEEIQIITDHLKYGGKWLQLAYPHSMWEFYEYSLFTRFGTFTDSTDNKKTAPTPWAEWYHIKKLLSVFKPAKFLQNWCGVVTFEFIWFDLTYLGKEDE